ncbi:MAG: amidohydrolase family protein [Deltaproteobacteria bacterium]|nr:amidohydrolase family protein [Deltaproteobacteria bacterium]
MKGNFHRFDAHVHVGKWQTPDFAGRSSDLDDVSSVLADAGLTGALLMPTDAVDNQGLLEAIRAFDTDMNLLFAAWIDPEAPGLKAFLDHGDVRALKFHPSFQRRPITDESFRPFLELAARRGLPVVVHCGRWREVAGFELALEAASRYPGVPFVLSHMGGDSAELVLGAARAIGDNHLQNVYLGTESIREYWLVQRALDIVGPRRVVFGSDHNLNHPASFLAVVEALDISSAERNLVLGGNAKRLFGSGSGPGA